MTLATRRRHRPATERQRLEALERIAVAAFAYRQQLELEGSPLECMSDREWTEYAIDKPRAPRAQLAERACHDCTAAFQADAQRLGRCNPPPGALTPAERLVRGAYGVDEPLRRRLPGGTERRRRRRPWAA